MHAAYVDGPFLFDHALKVDRGLALVVESAWRAFSIKVIWIECGLHFGDGIQDVQGGLGFPGDMDSGGPARIGLCGLLQDQAGERDGCQNLCSPKILTA